MGPITAFYSIYMSEQGYDKIQIGLLWALGVLAEVALFVVMPRLLRWTGLRNMVLFGMAVCSLRWLMISQLPEQLWAVLLAQCFHAVTRSVVYMRQGSRLCINFFPPRVKGRDKRFIAVWGLESVVRWGLFAAVGSGISLTVQ